MCTIFMYISWIYRNIFYHDFNYICQSARAENECDFNHYV